MKRLKKNIDKANRLLSTVPDNELLILENAGGGKWNEYYKSDLLPVVGDRKLIEAKQMFNYYLDNV